MVKFTKEVYSVMMDEIKNVSAVSENILQVAERSFTIVQNAIIKVKDFILDYTFKDIDEEIRFFKEIKPLFLRELFYYNEIYSIEAHKPLGSIDQLNQYYTTESHRLGSYFSKNQSLYNYYKTEKSNQDGRYFVREAKCDMDCPENIIEIDDRFSTIYSNKLSRLQAFELTNEYLRKCIYKIENPETFQSQAGERKFSNLWTDSKVALIELAYALQARGAVNNGKGDIKQIITDLEIMFNVQLGNFYRTFQNMRIRKKNATPFLDGLKESLERKMEENY